MREEIDARLHANLARVRAIVGVYQERAGAGSGRRPVEIVDLLRAAVVFLHATMEDVLRSGLEWKWPDAASPELLVDVPVVGNKKVKIELADLIAHRGKTVDEVIRLSIVAQLERSNFNNVGDLRTAVARMGLDPNLVIPYQGELAAMMGRRHRIVHRADRLDEVGSGHHGAASLGQSFVMHWVDAVDMFCTDLIAKL